MDNRILIPWMRVKRQFLTLEEDWTVFRFQVWGVFILRKRKLTRLLRFTKIQMIQIVCAGVHLKMTLIKVFFFFILYTVWLIYLFYFFFIFRFISSVYREGTWKIAEFEGWITAKRNRGVKSERNFRLAMPRKKQKGSLRGNIVENSISRQWKTNFDKTIFQGLRSVFFNFHFIIIIKKK